MKLQADPQPSPRRGLLSELDETLSLTETEPENEQGSTTAFPVGTSPVRASFVKEDDADILCDVCERELLPGQCQICWVQTNSTGQVKSWLHSDCFTTFCCQEDIESEALHQLCVELENITEPSLKQEVNALAMTLMDIVQPEDSQAQT